MLPFISVSANVSNGPSQWDGTSRDLEGVLKNHTMQVVYQSGTPTSITVELQGSVDAVVNGQEGIESRWVTLAILSGEGVVTADTHYVRYVKARITEFTGPTNTTVTASIASTE